MGGLPGYRGIFYYFISILIINSCISELVIELLVLGLEVLVSTSVAGLELDVLGLELLVSHMKSATCYAKF